MPVQRTFNTSWLFPIQMVLLPLSGSHNVDSDNIKDENRDAVDNEEARHDVANKDEDREPMHGDGNLDAVDNEEERHDDAMNDNNMGHIWKQEE